MVDFERQVPVGADPLTEHVPYDCLGSGSNNQRLLLNITKNDKIDRLQQLYSIRFIVGYSFHYIEVNNTHADLEFGIWICDELFAIGRLAQAMVSHYGTLLRKAVHMLGLF